MNNKFNLYYQNLIHIEFYNIPGELNSSYHFYVDKNLISPFKIRNGIITPPPRGYKKVRVDSANHSGQKHIHIYKSKNEEFISINKDGTRHHKKGEEIRLPNDLYKWIKKYFPDFNLPQDQIIRYGKTNEQPIAELPILIDVHDSNGF